MTPVTYLVIVVQTNLVFQGNIFSLWNNICFICEVQIGLAMKLGSLHMAVTLLAYA